MKPRERLVWLVLAILAVLLGYWLRNVLAPEPAMPGLAFLGLGLP